MNNGITSRETTISALFAPGEELSMPPYQRSYSWTDDEVTELFSDLRDAADNNDMHFIGAIVTVRKEDGTSCEIVDGQQRLTTLTILLSVLRDLEEDPAEAEKIDMLISDRGRPMLGEEAKWRLSLNHVDGPFFRATIQEPGSTRQTLDEPGESDSQRRMTRTAAIFLRELEPLDLETRRMLFHTVAERCAVVRVNVSDRDKGYRVFRVLNTRGKQPAAHDIVKTELLERSGFTVEEADQHSRQWSEYEARLGGSAFDDLLGHVRFIHDRSGKGNLIVAFRKPTIGKMTPREFLSTVLPAYVQAYHEIITGEIDLGAYSEPVRAHLHRLRTLDHHSWRAPALRFLMDQRTAPEDALEFFRNLERLGFILQLVVPNRDQRNRRYRRVIDGIDSRRRDTLFGRTGPFAISEAEIRKVRERLTGRFATFSQRRALALRLNAAIAGGATIEPDADATVEHVLPRNPDAQSHWMKVWPSTKMQRDLCDTIGNFVLLPHAVNQEADRLTYQDKKKIYFNGSGGSVFALTRDLEDIHTWTPETVRTRTERLAEILCRDWGLNA